MSQNVNDRTLTLRLPGSLVDALDEFTESLNKETPPGVRRMTRSDTIRKILLGAMADLAPKDKRRK